MKTKSNKIVIFEVFKHIIILLFLILTSYPFIILIFKSFKTPEQNIYHPFTLSFPLEIENYKLAWAYVGHYIMNTVTITAVGTILIIIFAALAAYVFACYDFPGKSLIYWLVLSLMMVPGILTLVPLFQTVDKMSLLNTKWAVILPGIRSQLPFGVFLLTSFFKGIPGELFEASRIDGAGMRAVFFKIALPLSKPILTTLGILSVLFFWNDVIWPCIALQTENQYTIAIGMRPFTTSYMSTTRNYGPVMAGYCIVSIPLLIAFFFASKQFIAGITSGAVKM